MKEYREYERQSIGSSDIASLTLRDPMNTYILNFGEDNDYMAYIVDEEAIIGSHYHLEAEFQGWLKIYDDYSFVTQFTSNTIKVYRAGMMGCIIQLIHH